MSASEAISQRPGAVLFDLDNTIYDYTAANDHAYSVLRLVFKDRFGISSSEFDAHFRLARDATKAQLGAVASSHSRLLYMQNLLEAMGLGSQVMLALELEQIYWRELLSKAEVFPKIYDVLDELRKKKIPIGCVTDLTSAIQFRKIIYFGLEKYFDVIVTSEESGKDKPHSASFLLAKQKLGDVPGGFWMVGDDIEKDMEGSKKAIGATTFYYSSDSIDSLSSIFVDVQLSDYQQLLNLVSEL